MTRVEAIKMALEQAGGEGDVFICHGPPQCTKVHGPEFNECEWCHVVREGEHRTPEQIAADIESQRRGH